MTTITEDFAGTGALSTFTILGGYPASYARLSGLGTCVTGSDLHFWNGNTFAGDQEASITVAVVPASDWGPGPALKIDTTSGSHYSCTYTATRLFVQRNGGSGITYPADTGNTISVSSGDVIRFTAVANVANPAHLDLKIYKNATLLLSWTDTSPLSGTRIGLQAYYGDTTWRGDNYTGGDYSAGADTTAPTLTSPTGTQTGSTTGSGTVTTDEANGTLYSLATTNATETAATVKASGATQTITSTGSKSATFTGLTPSTAYYAHYVHRDAAGNDSTRVSSSSFTTTAGSSPPLFRNNPGGALSGLGSGGPFFQNPLQ